jgi:hypothetical protein
MINCIIIFNLYQKDRREKMRSCLKPAILITIMLFLTACMNQNWKKPEPDSLILGKTTYDEIKQQFGKPAREGTVMKNGSQLKTLTYVSNTWKEKDEAFKGIPARSLGFWFKDNVLVGHGYNSSFKSDCTFIDPAKVKQIKKGGTTFSQAIDILGKNYGECLYPLVKDEEGRGITYNYFQNRAGFLKNELYSQFLIISFNKQDVVTDVDFTTSGKM